MGNYVKRWMIRCARLFIPHLAKSARYGAPLPVAAPKVLPRFLAAVVFCLHSCFAAHAAVYYVTVAGLGGEPDYEQRFSANARDLDKLFKQAGSAAHVYTLTGNQATRAQLTADSGYRCP